MLSVLAALPCWVFTQWILLIQHLLYTIVSTEGIDVNVNYTRSEPSQILWLRETKNNLWYSQSTLITNSDKCFKLNLQMLWSRDNLPQVAGVLLLQEQFEWGPGVWLKQRVREADCPGSKKGGYCRSWLLAWPGKSYPLTCLTFTTPSGVLTDLWKLFVFPETYGLIVKNSNIKNWTCNLAIKWIIFLKQRGIFLAVQWLRQQQTRKPETRVRNTHHFLVIL